MFKGMIWWLTIAFHTMLHQVLLYWMRRPFKLYKNDFFWNFISATTLYLIGFVLIRKYSSSPCAKKFALSSISIKYSVTMRWLSTQTRQRRQMALMNVRLATKVMEELRMKMNMTKIPRSVTIIILKSLPWLRWNTYVHGDCIGYVKVNLSFRRTGLLPLKKYCVVFMYNVVLSYPCSIGNTFQFICVCVVSTGPSSWPTVDERHMSSSGIPTQVSHSMMITVW